MSDAGFTVVRTYTTPPDDVVELAHDWGLLLLAGVFYSDWRYLVGCSRRQHWRVGREARQQVRDVARRLSDSDRVLALCLGNEIPADVVRWLGTERVAQTIQELADAVREEDPERLVTYANYPTAEYLPLDNLDFLTFNVFLDRPEDLRAYLTRLHHLAGDRPLVLGEVGCHAADTIAGEQQQADVLDRHLRTVVERGAAGACIFSWTDEWWVGDAPVEDWRFGLTRRDRSPRPALTVAARWNRRTVRDLRDEWPSISVVICAYNAEATIDECLRHTCALDYPNLEVVVVDDGSTDATADIARRHPRARLVRIPHGGLSVARNEGVRQATGAVIAFLDSDAYPSAEWPYYLALGFDRSDVGGVGGPNVPPSSDPVAAHVVARSPGGPVHVLLSDDRAEHVPGCNMAFWRIVLDEVGGFDPVYSAAGDDVDFCWRTLDRQWEIGFHPAALVWHHRRPGLLPYLRQQLGYGRAEALVQARHPDRFNGVGTARWRGRIYSSVAASWGTHRVYHGTYGTAAYQSVYGGGGHLRELAHQVGVPVAAVTLCTAPLALASPWLLLPALVAAVALAALAVVDAARVVPPPRLRRRPLFRASVALHHLLQPIVRLWGRSRARRLARSNLPPPRDLPAPVHRLPRGVVMLDGDAPRADVAAAIIAALRRVGVRILCASGWEDYDARLLVGVFVYGDLQTSSHPIGFIQARIRQRLRWRPVGLALAGAAALTLLDGGLGVLGLLVVGGETLRGAVRARTLLARTLRARDAGGAP